MSETNPSTNKKSNFFSEWLEQLQQESWQLELLISGLALFGIWESRGLILRLEYYFDVNSISDYSGYTNLITTILWAGWAIFLINLLIHIIIRGLWIGAIGLRYVSGEVDFEKLNYSDIFIRYYKKSFGTFDNYIERLERLSSVLFSFTFLLFFMFFSFAFTMLVFALCVQLLAIFFDEDAEYFQLIMGTFVLSFFGLGLLVFIDFITLGSFKKVKDKTFSRIYFWLYRFYSQISLSFIFRPILLNFIDNTYTRKLFFLSIPYGLVLLGGFKFLDLERNNYIPQFDSSQKHYSVVMANSIDWNAYDDLREAHFLTFNNGNDLPKKKNINWASIDQYEQDGESIQLFLEFWGSDVEHIEKYSGYQPFRKQGLRHNLFFKNNIKDTLYEKLDLPYLEKSRLLRQIVKNPDEEIEESLRIKYADDINNWRSNPENETIFREELKSDLEAQRTVFMENKLSAIRKAFLGMYTIKIDGEPAQLEKESYFYTHPNMHEKGLLCYIAMDSLSNGNHLLKLVKKRYLESCGDDCRTYTMNIPFRKK